MINGNLDSVVTLQGGFIFTLPSVNQLPTNVPPVIVTAAAFNANSLEKMAASNAVFIRANQRFTFYAMMGTYRICYTQGEDWDSSLNRFTRNASYACLQKTFYFSLPFPSFKKQTLTLNPAKGGNLQVLPQTQALFPHI